MKARIFLILLPLLGACGYDGSCENPADYEIHTCRHYETLSVDSAMVGDFKFEGKSLLRFRDSLGNLNDWYRETNWKVYSKEEQVLMRSATVPCGTGYCYDKVTLIEYKQIWTSASANYKFALYLAKDYRGQTEDSMSIVNLGDVLKVCFLDNKFWDQYSYPLANQKSELDTVAHDYQYFDSLRLNGETFYQVSRIRKRFELDPRITDIYCNPDLGWIGYSEKQGKLWVRED